MILSDLFEGNSAAEFIRHMEQYRDDPDIHVSFTDIEKMGINPRDTCAVTPLGVYAYPITHALRALDRQTIPFASGREHLYVLRATGRMLEMNQYSDADLSHDLNMMAETCADLCEFPVEKMHKFINRTVSLTSQSFITCTSAQLLWASVDNIAAYASSYKQRRRDVVMNLCLRRLGYDGVVDRGDGIIHGNESYQTAFLTRSSYRVVESLRNNHLKPEPPYYRKD